MAKFAILFSGAPAETPQGTDTDAAWRKWISGLDRGVYHSGSAFPMQGNVVAKDQVTPFIPSKASLGGYVVIDAPDLLAATDIAKTAPHTIWGGLAEVRPCRDLS